MVKKGKNNSLTHKIPFWDMYGDMNLVGQVIKFHKARRDINLASGFMGFDHVTNQIYISIHIQKWHFHSKPL